MTRQAHCMCNKKQSMCNKKQAHSKCLTALNRENVCQKTPGALCEMFLRRERDKNVPERRGTEEGAGEEKGKG